MVTTAVLRVVVLPAVVLRAAALREVVPRVAVLRAAVLQAVALPVAALRAVEALRAVGLQVTAKFTDGNDGVRALAGGRRPPGLQ